ncbi:DsbA family protein [Gordonia soli]|uniref:Thioredoxin-like fold domain-containing protein n=1 Tax=Gordonia soli NBRC 108243 TaxID=1223545 RepID=M0QDH2_9ACTN|nr:DsbA family protein [Gordonia soli]GAC66484.1 hypothetical protein GS4_02_01950 [Gordonia soli NBRC 108243]
MTDRDALRNKSAELLDQRRKSERRRRLLIQGGVVAAIVVIVAAVVVGVVVSRSGDDTSDAATPAGVTATGAIRLGDTNAPVVITVVEDLQCPACRQFESISGSTLSELSQQKGVAVDYTTIAILDKASSTDYSSRAANASYCVAEADVAKWPAWHTTMFDEQPAEGSAGLTDDRLVEIAKDAGVGGDVANCITDGKYRDRVRATTQTALGKGVQGTPTVFVNDSQVQDVTPAGLRAAVAQAQK